VGIVPYKIPINLYGYIVGADVIPLIGEMSEGQKGLGEAVPHIIPFVAHIVPMFVPMFVPIKTRINKGFFKLWKQWKQCFYKRFIFKKILFFIY
jgi:hypothetical protein